MNKIAPMSNGLDMKTNLRQIEILTNAWDTISNMWINDEKLSTQQQVVLDELTERIIEEMSLYLKLGQE